MSKKYLTKYIVLSFIFKASCNPSCFALPPALSLQDVDLEHHAIRYNQFLDVEEAHKNMQEHMTFHAFLKKSEECTKRYGLEHYVGLRLIHKHFPLENNQIMVEEYQNINDTPSLVTYSHSFEEAKIKNAYPSSWVFDSKDYNPHIFEASTDVGVSNCTKLLQKSSKYFNEMAQLLRENKLEHLIAIAILHRESLIAKEEQIYLEENDSGTNKSVIQLWNVIDKPKHSLETSWSFGGPKQQACVLKFWCRYYESVKKHAKEQYHQTK